MASDDVRIFLSHRTQDAELAWVISGALERLAGPRLGVFRASSDLTLGGDWASQTQAELDQAQLMIALVTGEEADWSWVLYEVGRFTDAADEVRRPIIPFSTPDTALPPPLQIFQGVRVELEEVRRFLVELVGTDRLVSGPLVADVDDGAVDDAARTIIEAWPPASEVPGPSAIAADEYAVFLSYRREDSAHVCGRIWDRLKLHFGADAVFRDVDSIPLGVDFRARLQEAVRRSRVMLVAIGPDWLTIADDIGRRRLNNPDDFVRIEVESALSLNLPIIPLLVRGASMPHQGELPPTLDGLRFRNGLVVRADPDFEWDMDRLKSGIEGHGIAATT